MTGRARPFRPGRHSTRRPSWQAPASYFCFVLLLVVMRRAGSLRARKAASAEIRPKLHAAAGGIPGGRQRRFALPQLISGTHPADIADVHSAVSDHGSRQRARPALRIWRWSSGWCTSWYEECRARDLVRRRAAFANLAFASVLRALPPRGGRPADSRDEGQR